MGQLQTEFLLRVAVCAWCKPKDRRAELGTHIGDISHGICPRHFKKLTQELQKKDSAKHPAPTRPRSQRRGGTTNHPELNY